MKNQQHRESIETVNKGKRHVSIHMGLGANGSVSQSDEITLFDRNNTHPVVPHDDQTPKREDRHWSVVGGLYPHLRVACQLDVSSPVFHGDET
jgi:hypothetical protein